MTPGDLGFPAKFQSFRDEQLEAMEFVQYSNKKFVALGLPTGAGKAALAVLLHKMQAGRSAILTSTLGLQRQYLKDFSSMGMLEAKGRNNYSCWMGENCSDGQRLGCSQKDQCPYIAQINKCKVVDMVVTNYPFWLHQNAKQNAIEGKKGIDLLIADECHSAPEQLSSFLDFRITQNEADDVLGVNELNMKLGTDFSQWQEEAFKLALWCETEIIHVKMRPKSRKIIETLRRLEALKEKFEKIQDIKEDNWIIEKEQGTKWGRVWRFECVWPGQYGYKLWGNAEKVILMSATIRPKTLSLLGISRDDYDFKEWAPIFAAKNRPVVHVPTCRVDSKTKQDTLASTWINRIDEIIAKHKGEKGIIHTVSYSRAQFILERSRYKHRMIANTNEPDGEKAAEVCERFKASKDLILVSPSFSTGWDFPGDKARWQIITKVPFPDTRTGAIAKRQEQDKNYGTYYAAQEIVQAAGRIVRHHQDFGITYCVDDHVSWFKNAAKPFMPRGFDIRRVNSLNDR